MSDKEKQVPLKDEELKKVSGGKDYKWTAVPENTGLDFVGAEESDNSNITGRLSDPN